MTEFLIGFIILLIIWIPVHWWRYHRLNVGAHILQYGKLEAFGASALLTMIIISTALFTIAGMTIVSYVIGEEILTWWERK